jgi:hypothetical protein
MKKSSHDKDYFIYHFKEMYGIEDINNEGLIFLNNSIDILLKKKSMKFFLSYKVFTKKFNKATS